MMKKVLALASVFVLAFALVACGGGNGDGSKPDGVYTAQVDAAYAEANYGWTDRLTVTYKGGVIVEAEYESYDADGNRKSEDAEYAELMGYAPAEWMPLLSKNVVDAGTANDISNVAGATKATGVARLLLAAIESEGKAGETITVTIPVTE